MFVSSDFAPCRYVHKRFCVRSDNDADTLAAVLYDELAGAAVGPLELLKFILMGANVKFRHAESGATLLHATLSAPHTMDPALLVQLLVFNDCPVDAPSGPLQKVIQVRRKKFQC